MIEWSLYLKIFTGLFAIINPLGAIPIYISLLGDEQKAERKRHLRITALTVFCVLTFVLFTGEAVLHFFSVSLESFKIAGGLLIMLMAFSMLQAKQPGSKHTREERLEAQEKESVAVVPLAIPLLAGPGAISFVIMYSSLHQTFNHKLIIFLILLIISSIIYILFYIGPAVTKFLGKTGINIFTRIMGLFIAAIGVELITSSLIEIFHRI